MDDKQRKYRDLIERVKTSYPARDPSDDGKELRLYWCNDCEEINLWTYWQGRGNLYAKIMLVGQDWGCPWDANYQPTMEQVRKANQSCEYDYLNNNPSPTDANLAQLFNELGYDITQPCPDLFFTNFILGYRNKGLSGGYKKTWADHDKGYFQELANIIEPKVILCLGKSTFEGVLSAFDMERPSHIKDYNSFIESEHNPVSVTLENGKSAHIFALAHCGAMGTLNRNRKKNASLDTQIEDWKKIIPYISSPQENLRPYIICHMTTSLDGKVTGKFLSTPECEPATNLYYQINRDYKADAFACGRVTMEGSFTGGWYPDLSEYEPAYSPMDYLVDDLGDFFAVAFDPHGRLGWKSNRIIDADEDPGYDKAQIIEVLTHQVSGRYLTYLQSMGIPYIFAGNTEIDIEEALFKLKAYFGINKLLLEGGSILNGAFQRAGVIDELSLVVAPIVADAEDKPLFMDSAMENYSLEDVQYRNGSLWLNYISK